MKGSFRAWLMTLLTESVLFPSLSARKKMAFRYLHGTGLEIGALQHPLEAPPGVVVRYVDYVTREENIRRYPHLDASRIVITDHIDNGFELSTFHHNSQDFIIANHVLEHAPNPLQTLLNWNSVLKKNGILFITQPNGSKNFDQGRGITSLEHMIEDYEQVKNGELEQFERNNREHYREFVEISITNLNKMRHRRPMTEKRKEEYLEKLVAEKSIDAHFHVFTKKSMQQLCNHLITTYAHDVSLVESVRSRFGHEYVLVLKKQNS